MKIRCFSIGWAGLIYKLISNLNGLLPINPRKIALAADHWLENLVFNGFIYYGQRPSQHFTPGPQSYIRAFLNIRNRSSK